jgi:hypothetical protein
MNCFPCLIGRSPWPDRTLDKTRRTRTGFYSLSIYSKECRATSAIETFARSSGSSCTDRILRHRSAKRRPLAGRSQGSKAEQRKSNALIKSSYVSRHLHSCKTLTAPLFSLICCEPNRAGHPSGSSCRNTRRLPWAAVAAQEKLVPVRVQGVFAFPVAIVMMTTPVV